VSDRRTRVVIRRFDAARDAGSLRECVIDQQNFHHTIEPSWPGGDAIVGEYVTYLETECAAHNGCILLAHCGKLAVGFVCVVATTRGESPDDPASFAWIHDIYVKPEHRQRGVASMLMAEAERFARGEGARSVRLGVLDGNERARKFYVRHGFREYTRVLTKPLERLISR
jgi:ribosomal protein S18 acetylase RimI-like enzyme